MTQGCVSESSHIRVIFLISENQTFIISASHRVLRQDLNRNVSLGIVLKGYPTKQTHSLLCISHGWAYALPPVQQF